MDKMQMSLDDIISMNKTSGGGGDNKANNSNNNSANRNNGGGGGGKMRRGRSQGQTRSTFNDGYRARAQELALRRLMRRQQGQGQGQAGRTQAPALASNKILVSNLAETVSESDVMELFQEFGRIRYAALHHDAAGNRLELDNTTILVNHCCYY